jgi:hypothetical protein
MEEEKKHSGRITQARQHFEMSNNLAISPPTAQSIFGRMFSEEDGLWSIVGT